MSNRVWVEIDTKAIEHNYEVIKQKAGNAKICCVVKDNAYGHGADKLSLIYEKLGASYFAVSNIDEAIALRNNGIKTPILILGYTNVEDAYLLNKYGISQCVYSLIYAKHLNEKNVKIKCHLKVDTGMNRLGFKDIQEMKQAYNLDNLLFEGIFTHFAYSENEESTRTQFQIFDNAIKELEKDNITFKIRHCANSASIFRYPEYNLDMVRPGIILYGLGGYPELKQALTMHSIISHIKYIEKGETVGYNRTFVADKRIKVATIPVGYGDGFLRVNKDKNTISINGKKARILGNICMDQMMVDVSDIDVNLLDEVIIYDDLEEYARNINTISYELICSINHRVPIIYK
jgi:alanine racemase